MRYQSAQAQWQQPIAVVIVVIEPSPLTQIARKSQKRKGVSSFAGKKISEEVGKQALDRNTSSNPVFNAA
jgi:hypothetical protein